MQTPRKRIIVVVVVLLLLVTAPAAFASGPVSSVTHQTEDGTVNWTLPAGQCTAVEVNGSGERHMEIITTVYSDGSSQILTNDLVKGTASDSTGTYLFTYFNHSVETVPAGGGAHQIEMVDSFVMNGNGSAKLNVGFNWRWTYTPPDLYWPPVDNWQEINTRGAPFSCDPI